MNAYGAITDFYIGGTFDVIWVGTSFSSSSSTNHNSAAQIGYGLLTGIEASISKELSTYAEYRYTHSDGDDFWLKSNVFEGGFKFSFNDSWGGALSLLNSEDSTSALFQIRYIK